LQPHFRIANVRNQTPNVAQKMVRLPEKTAPNLLAHQPQCRARFLQVFARFVDWRVACLFFAPCDGDGAFDLLAANPAKIFAQCLAMS
jgi:hypothetical protein